MHGDKMIVVADDLAVDARKDRAGNDEVGTRLTVRWLLLISVCFGLAAGLLELSILAVRVWAFEQGFFLRSEHFLWMVPLSDLVIYGSIGLALALWFSTGRRLRARSIIGILLFVTCMSQLLMVRGLNLLTCALLAWGIALRTAGWFEARLSRSWRLVRSGTIVFSDHPDRAHGRFAHLAITRSTSRWRSSSGVVAAGPECPLDRA